MKILMITPYLPFPIWSGGQIRTYNLLKNLSSNHEIHLFSFIRDKAEFQYIDKLKEYCTDVQVFLKRPPWSLESLTLSALTFYPLVVCMYLNRQVKNAIKLATEKQHFNLIHAETFYVMPNIPNNRIPTILVEQTIEYLVYKHYIKTVNNPFRRIIMNWDVAKIKFWEKTYWSKATRVVAMSETDRNVMRHLIPNLIVDLVPNGVDADYFKPKKKKILKGKKTLLFIGNFKWLQNREAVLILIRQVLPEIQKKIKNVTLWIVGQHPTSEIKLSRSSAVKISSDIADIRYAYENADVLIAPIYGPGGTRYKILESMAAGLPVVTTSTGIEGLGAIHESEALICDTPKEIAQQTIRLLTNPSLYQRLAQNGRKLVGDRFNWDSIADSLDAIYKQAAYGKAI